MDFETWWNLHVSMEEGVAWFVFVCVQRTIGHDWYEMTSQVAEAPVTQNALLDANFKQKADASKLALLYA